MDFQQALTKHRYRAQKIPKITNTQDKKVCPNS